MKYGSVCSGVEAATVAWHGLGWEPQWFSEIEKFPSAVLAYHYPNVPNFGDMTAFKGWPDDRSIDLLVGGTPCQSFSIAGLRKGLDDPRGNLMLTFLAIAERYRPRWLVWENVPGVLSSNRGKDFGTLLGAMGEIGYGFAYRICDAQYWGVPQRRRRVFVVGHLGDWRRAAAVLFERHSLQGHPAPSRQARQETAETVTTRAGNSSGGGLGTDEACSGYLQPTWPAEIASTLNAAFGDKQGLEDQHINSGAPLFVPDSVGPLTAGMHKGPRGTEAVESNHVIAFGGNQGGDFVQSPAVAFAQNQVGEVREGNVANTLNTNFNASGRNTPMLRQASAVRRLTPKECERLQGFPDDYTQIEWRNKPAESCPDGPRYKAMGNSMAVPVMRWLGERIEMVDKIEDKQ